MVNIAASITKVDELIDKINQAHRILDRPAMDADFAVEFHFPSHNYDLFALSPHVLTYLMQFSLWP